MTKTIHERIRQLISESGKKTQAVSREAGLDKETLPKLLRNPNQKPSASTVKALADYFSVSQSYIWDGDNSQDSSSASPSTEKTTAQPQQAASPVMTLDIPVMGTAAGSLLRGAFKITDGPVDYVRRPPSLAGAADVYALYVEGTSMEPQYFPGELIYVNPHRPPRQGDIVVVQSKDGDFSDIHASLGIYIRTTEHDIVIGKRNPQSEVRFTRQNVTGIHRVLSVNDLLGN